MLIVGTNKSTILDHLPDNFLLIDDGPIIDAITLPARKKAVHFDYRRHTFNPLKNISYRGARDFLTTLGAIFPQGENTLTRKNSDFILLNALLEKPKTLDKLLAPSDDPAEQDAYQKIQTILLSPVLENVLLKPANFSLKGIVLARLNRAELGDFDCFVLGNLLIGQYQGHVVVPDYGFYAAPHHTTLIRQDRLIAGVNFLDELPKQLKSLFLMGHKMPSHCTYDDAETLAVSAGVSRGTNAFTDFIDAAMK